MIQKLAFGAARKSRLLKHVRYNPRNQMPKPHFLLTNDDGIFAPGMHHLWKALSTIAKVTIVAPAKEQSASGLSITLRTPIKLEKVDWPQGTSAWVAHGTPADCVKLALNVVLESPPDYIVSGINRGNNAGRNILYSGTIAAVIEGIMHGIPGVAFSCLDYENPDYELAEQYVPSIMEHLFEHSLSKSTLLNVNFPSLPVFKGFKMASQGLGYWSEKPFKHEENDAYYWLGSKLAEFEEHDESDVFWLKQGYATAVPIQMMEFTDHQYLMRHKTHFESHMDEWTKVDEVD